MPVREKVALIVPGSVFTRTPLTICIFLRWWFPSIKLLALFLLMAVTDVVGRYLPTLLTGRAFLDALGSLKEGGSSIVCFGTRALLFSAIAS